jgi:DNA replication protein DnaC
MPMTQATPMLLKANLKQLKLPTMLAEHEKLAREAADADEPYDSYLLRLTEVELATRSANALTSRIRAAAFPVLKDFDTFDFTAVPSVPKQKVLELARGEWIDQHFNCCLIGGSGTGKTHVATSLGLALCRLGKRVRFVTAAGLVTQLEEANQQHRLDRLLAQLDRVDLLLVDQCEVTHYVQKPTERPSWLTRWMHGLNIIFGAAGGSDATQICSQTWPGFLHLCSCPVPYPRSCHFAAGPLSWVMPRTLRKC